MRGKFICPNWGIHYEGCLGESNEETRKKEEESSFALSEEEHGTDIERKREKKQTLGPDELQETRAERAEDEHPNMR